MFKKTIIIMLLFSTIGIFEFCTDCGGPFNFTYRINGIRSGFQSDTNLLAKNDFVPLADSSVIDAYGLILQLKPNFTQVADVNKTNFLIFGTAQACSPAENIYYQNEIAYLKITSLEKYNSSIGINDTIPLNKISLNGTTLNTSNLVFLFQEISNKNVRILLAPEINKYHRFRVDIITKEKVKYSTITPFVFLK